MQSSPRAKILLVDDSEAYFDVVRLALEEANANVDLQWAATGQAGVQAYLKDRHGFAVVILDYELPDMTGAEVADHMRKANPDQTLIFATGHRNPDYLIDILETGSAADFIAKNSSAQQTAAKIMGAVRLFQESLGLVSSSNYQPTRAEMEIRAEGLLGRSPAMLEVARKIRKFRDQPYPTLLVGATGTGKEYVAHALAPEGKRLVEVHCGRFVQSEQMLESELFGHVKGAFTGATHDKPGLLMQAHGHVLFLDELHTLPLGAQQKLLRFLETMRFRKVGDTTGFETSVKLKIIAAVQPDIHARIERGEFLPDLLGRVGDLKIQVPSLAERPEDIEPIIRFFQDEHNAGASAAYQKQFRLSTIAAMARHPWPLNIRDLRGAVRSLMTLTSGDVINPKDFYAHIQSQTTGPARPAGRRPLSELTGEVESTKIVHALVESNSVTETAERLGLSRWALVRKMSRLKIQPEAHLAGGNRGRRA